MRRSAWGWADRRGGAVNPEEPGGQAGGGFSAREPWRAAPLGRAGSGRQMPPEPPGAASAETGEPAGRGLTATGPRRSHWAPADG